MGTTNRRPLSDLISAAWAFRLMPLFGVVADLQDRQEAVRGSGARVDQVGGRA